MKIPLPNWVEELKSYEDEQFNSETDLAKETALIEIIA